jgi:hypothetical protein
MDFIKSSQSVGQDSGPNNNPDSVPFVGQNNAQGYVPGSPQVTAPIDNVTNNNVQNTAHTISTSTPQNPRDQYKNVVVEKTNIFAKQNRRPAFNPFKWLWWLIRYIVRFIFNSLKLIRNIAITLIVFGIIFFIAALFVAIYKPPVFWNPMKTFLNSDIQVLNTTNEDVDTIYTMINEKAEKESIVTLTEGEFSKIAFAKLDMTEENYVRFKKDKVFFYLNTESKERPLWNVVSVNVKKDEKMKILSYGVGRFDTPQVVSGFLNDTLGSVFSFAESLVTSSTNTFAFSELLMDKTKIDKSFILKDVKVEDSKIMLTYEKTITN